MANGGPWSNIECYIESFGVSNQSFGLGSKWFCNLLVCRNGGAVDGMFDIFDNPYPLEIRTSVCTNFVTEIFCCASATESLLADRRFRKWSLQANWCGTPNWISFCPTTARKPANRYFGCVWILTLHHGRPLHWIQWMPDTQDRIVVANPNLETAIYAPKRDKFEGSSRARSVIPEFSSIFQHTFHRPKLLPFMRQLVYGAQQMGTVDLGCTMRKMWISYHWFCIFVQIPLLWSESDNLPKKVCLTSFVQTVYI